MVERRIELNRKYRRKRKMAKLKAKLATVRDGSKKTEILRKINAISPWWIEPKPVKA